MYSSASAFISTLQLTAWLDRCRATAVAIMRWEHHPPPALRATCAMQQAEPEGHRPLGKLLKLDHWHFTVTLEEAAGSRRESASTPGDSPQYVELTTLSASSSQCFRRCTGAASSSRCPMSCNASHTCWNMLSLVTYLGRRPHRPHLCCRRLQGQALALLLEHASMLKPAAACVEDAKCL